MATVSRSFAQKVAQHLGADPGVVYDILNQWEPWENANADFNPLATTQPMPGYDRPLGGNPNQNNGNPVKEYANEDVGAEATARTLTNGYYPTVLNWIKTGTLSNPQAAAQEIRKWGTTGFANQIAGGGSVTTTPTSSPTTSSSFDSTDADFQSFLDSYLGPRKTIADFTDMEGFPAAAQYEQYLKDYTEQARNLSTAWANVRGPQAKGVLSDDQKRQQAIDNKIKALDLMVKAGQIDATAAATNLSAFVDQQTNIGKQVDQIAHAKDQAVKYGVSNGKTTFTQADFGTPKALLDLLGLTGDSVAIKYGDTPVTLDPEGDWNRLAANAGVAGNAPMLNPHMEALVRQGLDEWGRPVDTAPMTPSHLGADISGAIGGIGSAIANSPVIPDQPYLGPGPDQVVRNPNPYRPAAITPEATAGNVASTFRNLTRGWF